MKPSNHRYVKAPDSPNGRRATTEYWAWINIRRRCHDSSFRNFADWGGRGIAVCERWRESFENFLDDMGHKPSPHLSLDRINNDLGYEPGNCRWATMKVQSNNRRSSITLSLGDETMSESDWCKRLGLAIGSVSKRLAAGWDTVSALTLRRTPNGAERQRITARLRKRVAA
jgi:hypothetical protein